MLSSNSCIICSDSISDPVCRSCYLKQIRFLINDFKIKPLAKKIILKRVKKRFPIETLNSTECILCDLENVGVCYHCFSVMFTGILKGLNFSQEVIEEFGFNPKYGEIPLEAKLYDMKRDENIEE